MERMKVAGDVLANMKHLANPAFQRRLKMSDLMRACYIARSAAAEVKTGLFSIRRDVAARVVASAFLNPDLSRG